ncbi:hypothetical protein Ssi03_76140 [Sphaerisporangium siamense]|uniref:Uncharacterized protein n=1 Tax=Sphaerisporangium siamense TaxID=795645 RepID=A0A7W7G882_9ACTN|nr:hypothetical protein [Sphaerisporangium siamense]MBB4699294.1 hypothetical protein [Sphaerisporangium siamense]GII89624.1 hypothetical protein Ssi03_76140 [Sphaerisporangium siamense]
MAFRLTSYFELLAEVTSPLDLSTVSNPLEVRKQMALAQGAGAGQADMMWSDQRTITASGTDALDLAGALPGPFGGNLTFARIKAIVLIAAAGNTNNVNLVMPASNGAPLFLAAGDGIGIRPGGMFFWFDPSATGVAVTAGTGDLLNVINAGAGTPVTYDIHLVGAST